MRDRLLVSLSRTEHARKTRQPLLRRPTNRRRTRDAARGGRSRHFRSCEPCRRRGTLIVRRDPGLSAAKPEETSSLLPLGLQRLGLGLGLGLRWRLKLVLRLGRGGHVASLIEGGRGMRNDALPALGKTVPGGRARVLRAEQKRIALLALVDGDARLGDAVVRNGGRAGTPTPLIVVASKAAPEA